MCCRTRQHSTIRQYPLANNYTEPVILDAKEVRQRSPIVFTPVKSKEPNSSSDSDTDMPIVRRKRRKIDRITKRVIRTDSDSESAADPGKYLSLRSVKF